MAQPYARALFRSLTLPAMILLASLGGGTKLTVRGMRRDLRSSYQWGIDLSNERFWVLGTPGQGDFAFLPPPKQQYTALEISLDGSSDRWQYRGSYVVSRTWGNYPGLYNSDLDFGSPGQVTTFYMPHQARNSTGYLPNDRPHVVKASGSYSWPFGLVAGALVTIESGTPINDFAAGPLGPATPSFLEARGSVGRTPTLWDLGLRLAYDVPVGRGSRTRVLLDVLHVGNPQRAVKVDEVRYTSTDDAGNPAGPNPQYRQATAYQQPMTVRLGVQVGF